MLLDFLSAGSLQRKRDSPATQFPSLMNPFFSLITYLALAKAGFCSNSAILFSENFDTNPGYISADGPNANNISSISFGAAGSKAPLILPGQFGGTGQYLSNTRIHGTLADGHLTLGSDQVIHDKSRNRSTVTFIDTSTAQVGQYRAEFDVAEFSSPGKNTALYFHLYEGGSTENGYINLRLTHQAPSPQISPSLPGITTGKGATIGRILIDQPISKNGKFSLNFGISEAGKPGDFLALVWTQLKRGSSAPMPSMTIDNIKVTKLLHAPASKSAVSVKPVGQEGSWNLLTEFSDEFNGDQINPGKWNNNPASWGAWSWEEKNTTQKDGNLSIQMTYAPHSRNGTPLFYKSGILRSHSQMTYGYYETRMRGCQLFPGACPAFWSYSDGKKYTGEVRYCEIDFVELQMHEIEKHTGKRAPVEVIDMNLHLKLADEKGNIEWKRPNSHPELCANKWTAPWDPRDDFHVYGCEVTPETITWYIDGKKVAEKPNTYWHEPMNLTLSLGLRHPHLGWVGQEMKPNPPNATEDGFPTSMEVDYVRVWKKK